MTALIFGPKVLIALLWPVTVSNVVDLASLSFDELFIGPKCRYPGCNNYVFFDRRVNELREWCSDEHMGCAVYLHPNDSEVAYIPLGLPFNVVWRSPVGTVGHGLVAMAISIAAGMFAGAHIHVRELL